MMPTRKVSVGALAGALSILILWGFKAWKPTIEIPTEIAQSFTVVLSALVSWIVPDAAEDA